MLLTAIRRRPSPERPRRAAVQGVPDLLVDLGLGSPPHSPGKYETTPSHGLLAVACFFFGIRPAR